MSENKLNYISLFSAAGIGCYGFKSELFECLSTCELLEKRIKFQKFNKICKKPEQYICGDITDPDIQLKLFQNIGNKKIVVPETVVVERNGEDLSITTEEEGCDANTTVEKSMDTAFLGNLITGGAFGSTTDSVTGKMWDYQSDVTIICK